MQLSRQTNASQVPCNSIRCIKGLSKCVHGCLLEPGRVHCAVYRQDTENSGLSPGFRGPGNRRIPWSCHRHPTGKSTEAPLAARHALMREQELCLLCQLLRQPLGLSVAKVNSDFLHYGKGLRMHSQAGLGSGYDVRWSR